MQQSYSVPSGKPESQMPVDFFPVAKRKLYRLSANRNPALTMTANHMAQEETETKINNYNHVKGFLNKTQYDKTVLGIQQASVSVPGMWV